MKKAVFMMLSTLLIAMLSCRKDTDPDEQEITGTVRTEHPRLFITKEDIPNIKNAAQSSALDTYTETKRDVDKLLNEPISFENPTAVNGTDNGLKISKVSQVAILYLITGEAKYLDYTKNH